MTDHNVTRSLDIKILTTHRTFNFLQISFENSCGSVYCNKLYDVHTVKVRLRNKFLTPTQLTFLILQARIWNSKLVLWSSDTIINSIFVFYIFFCYLTCIPISSMYLTYILNVMYTYIRAFLLVTLLYCVRIKVSTISMTHNYKNWRHEPSYNL